MDTQYKCKVCSKSDFVLTTSGEYVCQVCGATYKNAAELKKVNDRMDSKQKKQEDAEKKKSDAKLKEEQRKEELEAEQARLRSEAVRMATLFGKVNDSDCQFSIYRKADGSCFIVDKGLKYLCEMAAFKKEDILTAYFSYNPAEVVYTGASSGGISMGGVHVTEPSYSQNNKKTGNAHIYLPIKNIGKLDVHEIIFTDVVSCTEEYRERFGSSGVQKIYSPQGGSKEGSMLMESALKSGDYYKVMNAAGTQVGRGYIGSRAADKLCSFLNSLNGSLFKTADVIYAKAVEAAKDESFDLQRLAIQRLKSISGYKDADSLRKKLQNDYYGKLYAAALEKSASSKRSDTAEALSYFKELGDYKDAAIRASGVKENLKKATVRSLIISISSIVAVIALILLTMKVIIPESRRSSALKLFEAGEYEAAISAFEALDGYRDSEAQIENCETAILEAEYNRAAELFSSGDYENAQSAFEVLGNYKDSRERAYECTAAMQEDIYTSANALLADGEIIEAYELLSSISSYKDSSKIAKSIYHLYELEKIKLANVGDTVTFGAYQQSNAGSSGKEKIEWLVLDKEENRVLLISSKALLVKAFNFSDEAMGIKAVPYATWATSPIRSWLNDEFLNHAFSEEEQTAIQTSYVSADSNPKYGTSSGSATNDKVFLLSITEAEKYFASDEARACTNTERASKGWRGWWLRTAGRDSAFAAAVSSSGWIDYSGIVTGNPEATIRPAMWLDLGSD